MLPTPLLADLIKDLDTEGDGADPILEVLCIDRPTEGEEGTGPLIVEKDRRDLRFRRKRNRPWSLCLSRFAVGFSFRVSTIRTVEH